MLIAEIWRYQVKTMASEKLQWAWMGPIGIDGDRVVHVKNARGRVITAALRRFAGHKGMLGTDRGRGIRRVSRQ